MCRNIKTLFNFDPPATNQEIQGASLQFVRKLSGFNKPSKPLCRAQRASPLVPVAHILTPQRALNEGPAAKAPVFVVCAKPSGGRTRIYRGGVPRRRWRGSGEYSES